MMLTTWSSWQAARTLLFSFFTLGRYAEGRVSYSARVFRLAPGLVRADRKASERPARLIEGMTEPTYICHERDDVEIITGGHGDFETCTPRRISTALLWAKNIPYCCTTASALEI
jgi:hypothetical protein